MQVISFFINVYIYREADIERRDEENYTPLLLASVYGRAPTVDLLIQKEADIAAVDKNDKTAIFLAAEENQLNALEVSATQSYNVPEMKRLCCPGPTKSDF